MSLLLLLAGGALGAATTRAQEGRHVDVVAQHTETAIGGEGQRWAIVVGVDRYKDPTVPLLNGAVADAKAIAGAIVHYADFLPGQVLTLTTDGATMPTSAAIIDAFSDLRSKVKPGDLFLFFFAGHGVEVEGRRFLLTHEAQISSPGALKTTSLAVPMLMQEIESLPVRHRIILVDACRDDPLSRGKPAPNLSTALMEAAFTLARSSEGGIRATFLSCSPGESAYEWSEKGRGFFSYSLERALSGDAAVYGKVTLNSLADYLNENVPRFVRQERGRVQTPFSDIKGESFTLVRGEKLDITPEHLRSEAPQTRIVYGVIKDAEGEPLPGTPVRLTWDQGSARGAAGGPAALEVKVNADEDGFFKAEVPAQAVVSVTAESSGFQLQTTKALPEKNGQKLRLFLARVEPAKTPPPAVAVAEATLASVPASAPATAPATVPGTADAPPASSAVDRPPSTPAADRPPTPTVDPPPATSQAAAAPPAPVAGTGSAEPPTPPPDNSAGQAEELARAAYQSFLVEDFESAEHTAREALDVDSDNQRATTVVTNCRAVRGVNKSSPEDLAGARDESQKLLEHDRNNALAHNALGLTFIGARDLNSAETEFASAIGLDPTLSMSEANLGYVRLQLGKLKDAEKSYRAAITLRPDGAVSYNGLAQVLLARGDAGGAINAARAAISRYEVQDEYLARFYVNLAVALYQNGEKDRALEAVARAKSLGLMQNPAYEIIERLFNQKKKH